MQTSTYPLLTHLVRAYLHQDWDLEYETKEQAIDDFVDNDPRGPLLLSEVSIALATEEQELSREAFAKYANRLGVSSHTWLAELRTHLMKRAEA